MSEAVNTIEDEVKLALFEEKIRIAEELTKLIDFVDEGSMNTSHWRRAVKCGIRIAMQVVENKNADDIIRNHSNVIMLRG